MDLVRAAFTGVYAVAVMLALWPRHETGRRFLRRWHVGEPDDEQIAVAVRYLRERRVLMVPFVVLFASVDHVVVGRQYGYDLRYMLTLLGALLMGLLLAESLAGLRRRRGTTRTALLVRRRAGDLVPAYAVWLYAGLTVMTVGVAVAGLVVQPAVTAALQRLPPNEQRPDGSGLVLLDESRADLARAVGWPILAGTALITLVVLGVVWRSAVRAAHPDHRVDLVLRTRSARVAVGAGMALIGQLGVEAIERLSIVESFLRGQPQGGIASLLHTYPVAGPAFPADAVTTALPGWLHALSPAIGPLGLALLLTSVLGWVWVANPPARLPQPSPV